MKFIGIFEHFYDDSIFEKISTHYVNHGYLVKIHEKNEVHKYVKDYFKNLNLIAGEYK